MWAAAFANCVMDNPRIFRKAASLLEDGENVALVTVIATTGSTPGKVGYKMLVYTGGRETFGTVGGGLVEAKMIEAARDILAEPTTQLFRFDLGQMPEDENGICGGTVEFLVESLDRASLPTFRELSDTARTGQEGVLVSVISPDKPPQKVFLADKAPTNTGLNARFPADIAEAMGQAATESAGPRKVSAGNMDVFLERVETWPTVVILGAGHLAKHICKYAKSVQFRVTVCDDRSEYASRERFPDADEICEGDFGCVLEKVGIDSTSYIVIVTHGHKYDEVVLEQAVRTNARYIGMIGSKRKVRLILQKLARKGVPEGLLNRVYSPIGISIGALTPEEIALSIVCELVKIRRLGPGGEVGHMKELAWRDVMRESV